MTSPATVDSGRGWLMVAGAALAMFTVFGVGYSFGVFFDSITADFGSGSGATAIVFGITICLSFVLSPFTGALADRLGPRPVLWIAAAALASGLLLTTIVPSIWLAYVSYGVGVGVAIAAGYVPMVATVSGWFEERRALALGVAVAGIGAGTMIAAPVSEAIISRTSWRSAYVAFAVFGATTLLLISFVVSPGPAAQPAPPRRGLLDMLGDRTFRMLYVSMLVVSIGLFVPFVFIVSYAREVGIEAARASLLVGLIGGASIAGRLLLGSIGSRVDAMGLFRVCFVLMAIALAIWLVADDRYWQLVAFTLLFGTAYGGFIALAPAVAAARFGLAGLGGLLGTWYTAAAWGALFGPPLAGWIIDRSGWTPAIVMALVCMLAGTGALARL